MELKKEIREVKHKVNNTYEFALDAWGQSTENRVWLESIITITARIFNTSLFMRTPAII